MKSNFAAYIEREKARVRAERECEIEFILPDGENIILSDGMRAVRDSSEILNEIDNLRGLNKKERAIHCNRGDKSFCAA